MSGLFCFVLLVFAFGRVSNEEDDDSLSWEPCSFYCECAALPEGGNIAQCDLTATENPCDNFVLPNGTTILDLSGNGLVEVPSCLLNQSENIISLLLGNNQITVIKEDSFPRMHGLRHLDLSFNGLHEWKGDVHTTLPSLVSIDLTGNDFFIPGDMFFAHQNIVAILGLTWSKSCKECHLVRTEFLIDISDDEPACIVENEECEAADEVEYGMSCYFVKRGFSPQCLCEEERCFDDEIGKPYDLALNTLPRQLFYIEYVLGGAASILNVLVVIIIFSSPLLRKNTSFILIGNIALCDIMMGVYSVLIGRYTVYEFIVNEDDYPGMDVFVNDYCTVMGVIFTTAQITAVSSSFLATLEKYLSIVHCMNPNIRLRKPIALWCLAGIWLVAIGYSLLAVFKVGGLRYHGEFTCMMPFVDGPSQLDVSIIGLAVTAFLVLLYLISIALYIHIFLHVRKAGVSAGVKRKAALAKSISLMVFSNFLFFIIPMMLTLLFVFRYDQLIDALKIDSLSGLKTYFIVFSWLPVIFLSFNSCLNPFLCAFRHPKVQQEIGKCFNRCKCACLRRSQKQHSQVWVLSKTKRFDLSSTDASVMELDERFTSLETL